jgi:serine/threonine-protein kinase RsbW
MLSNNNKELRIKSRTENLASIRDFVSSYATKAGLSGEEIDNIMLAVDEACTNIIKHAYKSFPDGELSIKLDYDKKKFTITILDFGSSFDPDIIPKPDLQRYYKEGKVGGLGMYLMKTLMDEVKYTTVRGKYNKVLLTKNINA